MESIGFYTDENVANAVAEGLRRLGIDVLTTAEAGMLEADDPAQLQFALDHGRTLFTQDVDFITIAYSVQDHAGIVYAKRSTPLGAIVSALQFIHAALSAEEMRSRLEIV